MVFGQLHYITNVRRFLFLVTKKIIIVCIIVILISFAEMLLSLLLFPKQPMLNIIGIFFCIIAMLIFYRIDNRDKEKHIRKYVYSHKKKK